jgi:hypothetical protein
MSNYPVLLLFLFGAERMYPPFLGKPPGHPSFPAVNPSTYGYSSRPSNIPAFDQQGHPSYTPVSPPAFGKPGHPSYTPACVPGHPSCPPVNIPVRRPLDEVETLRQSLIGQLRIDEAREKSNKDAIRRQAQEAQEAQEAQDAIRRQAQEDQDAIRRQAQEADAQAQEAEAQAQEDVKQKPPKEHVPTDALDRVKMFLSRGKMIKLTKGHCEYLLGIPDDTVKQVKASYAVLAGLFGTSENGVILRNVYDEYKDVYWREPLEGTN